MYGNVPRDELLLCTETGREDLQRTVQSSAPLPHLPWTIHGANSRLLQVLDTHTFHYQIILFDRDSVHDNYYNKDDTHQQIIQFA